MKRILILFACFLLCVLSFCGCQSNANITHASKSTASMSTEWSTAPKVYKDFDRSESANYKALYSDDEERDGTGVSDDVSRQIARAQGRFITIEDFYIEKESAKPLSSSVLSDSLFMQLQDDINGHNHTNDWFRLYYLIPYDEWVSFREITDASISEPCYYCIMENKTTKERMYLFFDPTEQTYTCMEYLLLDSNGLPKNTDNEYYFCETEQPDYWLNVIAKCDLQI